MVVTGFWSAVAWCRYFRQYRLAFIATGLGSRGLLWGPLGAELLACELEGEPLPPGRDHAGAVSPRRFLS